MATVASCVHEYNLKPLQCCPQAVPDRKPGFAKPNQSRKKKPMSGTEKAILDDLVSEIKRL